MVGVITTRHLLTHSAVIVHEFGARCLCRCLWRTLTADHAVTFLECTDPLRLQGACPRAKLSENRPPLLCRTTGAPRGS